MKDAGETHTKKKHKNLVLQKTNRSKMQSYLNQLFNYMEVTRKIQFQSSFKQNVILLTVKYVKTSNFCEFRKFWTFHKN